MDGRPDPETFQAISTSGFAYLAAASLGAFLDAEVTTVRDLGANGAIAVEARNAVPAGITSVEHGTYMDEEGARLLARNDVYWVPTLKALAGIVEHGAEAGIPGWAVEKARDAADAMDDAFEYARDAGVEIAMGTDAGTPFNYHADAPEELSMLVERGLSPAEAFEAATVAAADLLWLDDVGLVREGYRADVVALGSDPREDPTVYRDPDLVVADGAVVRRQNHNC